MGKLEKTKALSYPHIKEVVESIADARTKAMVVTQYALAARAGELIHYRHFKTERRRDENGKLYIFRREFKKETPGLLKENIETSKGRFICTIPNFKTSKQAYRRPFITPKEEFVYRPFKNWLDSCGNQVFNVRISRYRQLVAEALPEGFSSHCLRHSRATHLAQIFNFSAFEIKNFLGHSSLNTSAIYVSQDLSRSAAKMEAVL